MLSTNFWKNKKVLVTGHTGFKGSWLSVWLDYLGSEVYGYSLNPTVKPNIFSAIKDLFFDSYIGNINNNENLDKFIFASRPEIVFHLAAQPLVSEGYSNPINTWESNVIGTLNLLESLKKNNINCTLIVITTDKVYENKEWNYGYRENDLLGGYDPYSASKAAVEILTKSWFLSFVSNNEIGRDMRIATVRSGNVVGGGDWSANRIVPDSVKAIIQNKDILIRNPQSRRPWLHVIEPLCGYLKLAEVLTNGTPNVFETYNFGPKIENNKTVQELVEKIIKYWKGNYKISNYEDIFHETKMLFLNSDKAYKNLNWYQRWDFDQTIQRTINWYKGWNNDKKTLDLCLEDIKEYTIQN